MEIAEEKIVRMSKDEYEKYIRWKRMESIGFDITTIETKELIFQWAVHMAMDMQTEAYCGKLYQDEHFYANIASCIISFNTLGLLYDVGKYIDIALDRAQNLIQEKRQNKNQNTD